MELPGREHLLQFAEYFTSKWESVLSTQHLQDAQSTRHHNAYDWGENNNEVFLPQLQRRFFDRGGNGYLSRNPDRN